jgi:multidrug efflux pump subunit AcrA (membrane-fusion protein)
LHHPYSTQIAAQYPNLANPLAKIAIKLKPTIILAPIGAADAKQLERNGGNNAANQSQSSTNSTYEVTIEPDTLMLGNGVTKCQIRSGMEGKAETISKEKTMLQFVLRKARLLVNL